MLIWNGTEFVQFVGSKIVGRDEDGPITEPLDMAPVDTSRIERAENYLVALRNFLFDSDARFLQVEWQRRLSCWNGM